MANTIHINSINAAANYIKSLPTGKNGKGRGWSSDVVGIAALVRFIKSQKDTSQTIVNICTLAGIKAYALHNLKGGRRPDGTPWPELRAEVARLETESSAKTWVVATTTTPPSMQSQAATNGVTYTDAKWKSVDGGDIEVTKVLKYGTPEHSAFLRRVLPECGTVRA